MEEELNIEEPTFQFNSSDFEFVKAAIDLVHKFLDHFRPSLSPKQLIGLGHALLALKRLPNSTAGVDVEFGLFLNCGDVNFSEKMFLAFYIGTEYFGLKHSGHTYSQGVGSDSYQLSEYYININGERRNEIHEIYDLIQTFDSYLDQGATLIIEDFSSVDYDSIE